MDGPDDRDVDGLEIDPDLRDEIARARARHAADPSSNVLVAAPYGVLPGNLQDVAREHLAASSWGRMLVAGFDDEEPELTDADRARLWRRIDQAAAEGAAPAATRPPRSINWMRLAPALSTAAAAVIVVALWTSGRDGPPGRSLPPPEPRIGPIETVATGKAPLPVDHPVVRLGPAALTWRGTGQATDFLLDLKPALDAVRAQDYRRAVALLTILESRYPSSSEVLFYFGVSRLHIGDAPGAIAALQRAESAGDLTFADDIRWYLALAEQRTGAEEQAARRLRALCEGSGQRSAVACSALRSRDETPFR